MDSPRSPQPTADLSTLLNQSRFQPFHFKALLASSLGFFTSAYDLFIIGTALVLIREQWHLSADEVGLIGSISLIATFVGAYLFGHLGDKLGRKKIYGIEATLMTGGALLSAFAPNVSVLILARVILGLGIGGDYALSAVLMSEYANRQSRGRMVSLVFSAQALGLVLGPAVALALLGAGTPHALAWRIMLGLGALPAFAVIFVRRTLPESPRWLAQVKGDAKGATESLRKLGVQSRAVVRVLPPGERPRLWQYKWTLLGTAGTWFLFDYAYYGNTISTPMILEKLAPHAQLLQSTALSLLVFATAAVPGYLLAILTIDRIGHKRLQLWGFALLSLAFLTIGLFPVVSESLIAFLVLYGVSYFFSEFGPNTTTFVLASELYPTHLRTTGHGISAGTAKVGAFLGAFLFPVLLATLGLDKTLLLTGFFGVAGFFLTALLLPEPAGKTLEELSVAHSGSGQREDNETEETGERVMRTRA